MNLLEHYIVEVKSVEPYKDEWTKNFDEEFLKITVVTNCYGVIKESTTIESAEDWKKIKERGYFLW